MSARSYLREGIVLLGRYEIHEEVGRGGFSVVYRAHDRRLDRMVAIKLLVPPPASAEIVRERMRREVQIVRELAHEHIVAVYDFEDDGANAFVVMRLVEGENLADRVTRDGPLDVATAVQITDAVGAALSHAHEHGVVHRDVKPQNILIDHDGRALLTDFGSARIDDQTTITRTGAIVGTLGYLAPNLAAGGRADARDDIFALGASLFHALTGEIPALTSASADNLRKARKGVPAHLAHAVARALHPDPVHRFPTMRAFREALSEEADGAFLATTRCVVCNLPSNAESIVCDWCAAAAGGRDDIVVVVRGEDRATVRVPAPCGEAALRRVAAEGKQAIAVPVDRAWTAIPRSTWLLAALVALSGIGAWSVGATATALPGGVVALLLLTSAHVALTRTHPRKPARSLPQTLSEQIVTTLATLTKDGTARDVFGNLVARVRAFAALTDRHSALLPFERGVFDLCAAACDVALDLDAVDGGHAPTAIDEERQIERVRTRLVQRLLTATDQVDRISLFAVDADRAEHFQACLDELDAELLALREVEELCALGGSSGR